MMDGFPICTTTVFTRTINSSLVLIWYMNYTCHVSPTVDLFLLPWQVCRKLAQRADCWCHWSWSYRICICQNDGIFLCPIS